MPSTDTFDVFWRLISGSKDRKVRAELVVVLRSIDLRKEKKMTTEFFESVGFLYYISGSKDHDHISWKKCITQIIRWIQI